MTSMPESAPRRTGPADLTRFAWLSIAAAVATLSLKTVAAWLTGSVGLLSDAAESVVNLVAATVALVALRIAARPPDPSHNYGHGKAEFLSAAVEAVMIFVAAVGIGVTAVQRLLRPEPLEHVGPGLLVSVVAGVVNGAVALILTRAGRRHRSLALTADGKHLMTDVWTSVGVVVGVGLVVLTGNLRLDPVVALLVGANIVVSGLGLLRKATAGLMDHAIPDAPRADVERILGDVAARHGLDVHAVRSRSVGRIHLVSVHLVVPADWTVAQGHAVTVELESEVAATLPDTYVETHVEPRGQRCAEPTP